MRGLSLDINGFYSELKAPHQNTNWLAAPANSINSANQLPQNPVVRNNTLVGAGFGVNSGEVDNIYRPNAGGESWYLDVNGKFRVNDDLTLSGKLGKTHGVGYDRNDVYYQNNVDGGMVYALNGLSPASVSYPGGTTTKPGSTAWAGGGEAQSVDQEKYAQIDGEWRARGALVDAVRFGARFTRSAMLEVLGQSYIRTASAKGVPWARVVRGHALPNAAVPTVTVVVPDRFHCTPGSTRRPVRNTPSCSWPPRPWSGRASGWR